MLTSTIKFSRTKILNKPKEQVQFIVFEKFTSHSLVNNLHEKHITESQDEKNFAECVLFLICVTTLHLCYIKNALVFSQSDPHNFFMCIIESVRPEHPALQLCTCAIQKMHSFSANQTHIIFSCVLLGM